MSEPMESLGIELHNDFDDKVPRIRDVDLGRQLGLARPSDIRATIKAHIEILNGLGVLGRRPQTPGKLGGRPTIEYWLNKEQALIVASKSETDVGKQTLVMLVKVFSEFEKLIAERMERLPPFLRERPAPWTKTWQDELMHELCKLRGELFTGRHPRWCARINSVVYECLLGRELYAQLKALNPSPSKGHNHHQLITAEHRTIFARKLNDVMLLARHSGSLPELEDRLRFEYQGEPLQLPLVGMVARRPRIPGPKKALPKLCEDSKRGAHGDAN